MADALTRYPDGPGFKGNDGAETGRQAAEYYAGQGGRRRRQVLDGLAVAPGTAEELSDRVGLHWYLVRPRLSELKALGLVVDTGERGTGALGGKVARYRLATAEERSLFAAREAVRVEKEQDDA